MSNSSQLQSITSTSSKQRHVQQPHTTLCLGVRILLVTSCHRGPGVGRWCHQPAHLQPKKVCQRKEPADSCAVMTRGGESQQIYSVNSSRSVRVWDSGAKSSSRYFPLQEGCSPHSCPAQLRRALHGLTVWPAHPGMHGRTPSHEYSYSLSVTCSVFKSFPPLKKASYVTGGAIQPEFFIAPNKCSDFSPVFFHKLVLVSFICIISAYF